MANSKTRKKRIANRLKKKKRLEEIIEKENDIPDDDYLDDVQEVSLETSSSDVSEVDIEKDYIGDDVAMYYGPTSWDELDATREAEEKAKLVREKTWEVQDLVYNIASNIVMTPEQKGEAIAAVGDGFSARVSKITSPTVTKSYDIDLLEIESIIAKDKRHLPLSESISNFISKASLTSSREEKLPDGSFAFVGVVNGQNIRKYPIHNKSHVRNSLSLIAKDISENNLNVSDRNEILVKIKSVAKEMGIGTIENTSSSVIVEKDLQGNWRAVMWPTNNFMDLDGETISEIAHKEYVDWVNKNMHLSPVFITWHKPETVRKNRVDYVGYENGFVIMSAPLEEMEAANIFKAMKICDIGMSHGAMVIQRDPLDKNVILKYRTIEVSDLPLDNAANPYTDFAIISKEANMDQKTYLTELVGAEKAEEIIKKTGLKQDKLRKDGVTEKDKNQEPENEENPKPDTILEPVSGINKEQMDAILKQFGDSIDIDGLNDFVAAAQDAMEKVPILESLIKDLKSDQDEELAEKISPKIEKSFAWSSKRASIRQDTILQKDDENDEKLKKSKPETHWLSEISGVEPVEA
jgi:hypothetical protein